MGTFQINKIKSTIISEYTGLIDLADYEERNATDKDNALLTRALNAFVIQKLTNKARKDIANCICDGYEDNGIDCIFYDEDELTLYLSQSKWSHDGKGSPGLGDIEKYISGVRDIISCRFDKFNQKVQNRSDEIEDILYNTKQLKICLVLVHTGAQTSTHIKDRFDEFLKELNDTSDSFSFINIDQKKVFSFIESEGITKVNIDEILLNEWGKISDPKKAYYGTIAGNYINDWFQKYGRDLFSKNIRMILPDSEINEEIRKTIESDPENFWYYNNGITLIAKSITKRPINGDKRDFAIFDCEDVSIINGAQTVGTIGKYALDFKDNEEKLKLLEKVKLQIRLIDSQEDTRTNTFTDLVTKANNRQNKVENRDFISLEPNQKRLVGELRLASITYYILRSDDVVNNDKCFDLVESTRALSNVFGITASTLFHREPSKVWSDVKNQRYRQLFNPSVRGAYLWNIIRVQRNIDRQILELKKSLKGEKKSILTYGEDVISCVIFSKLKEDIEKENIMDESILDRFNINTIIEYCKAKLAEEIQRIGKGIPTVFKNFTNCEEIYINIIEDEEYKEISKFI